MINVAAKSGCRVAKVNNRQICGTKKGFTPSSTGDSRFLVGSKLIKRYPKNRASFKPLGVSLMLSSSLRPPECLRWWTHCSKARICVSYIISSVYNTEIKMYENHTSPFEVNKNQHIILKNNCR